MSGCPAGYGGDAAQHHHHHTHHAHAQTAGAAAGAAAVPAATDAASAASRSGPTNDVYYRDYLGLKTLLSAQVPLSKVGPNGEPAHEELLFIIIHQTYELWFKLILHEVDSIIKIFDAPVVPEREMLFLTNRLERVNEIFKVLVQQVSVLETMYPSAFLEFRAYLVPASGFQSAQFRNLENRLGLRSDLRLLYQQTTYKEFFQAEDRSALEHSEKQTSLFDVVERWLERTPFLSSVDFEWWPAYRKAVSEDLARQHAEIQSNPFLTAADRDVSLKSHEVTKQSFDILFDPKRYAENVANQSSGRHLSYRALQAALLINLFKNEPIFQMPYRLLTLLTDMDALLSQWRYRHAVMVQRMIGVKMGTGGSSGYHYLRTTLTDRYKVFVDLFHMSTYLLPTASLPTLPMELRRKMLFVEETDHDAAKNASTSSSTSASAQK